MKSKSEVFDAAIEKAIVTQFGRLFDVLMTDPSDAGVERFEKGLALLIDTANTAIRVTRQDKRDRA